MAVRVGLSQKFQESSLRLQSMFRKWFPGPRDVFESEDYRRANEFKESFTPVPDRDYQWVAQYAVYIYGQLDQAEKSLDSKAESIIKVFGGASGLLSLGAIINLKSLSPSVIAVLCVSLLFSIAAIIIAAWVRVPRESYLPPSVAWALLYVNFHQRQSEERFLAQWHLACEGMRLSLRVKAKGVGISTWCSVIALALVGVSFFVAVVTI